MSDFLDDQDDQGGIGEETFSETIIEEEIVTNYPVKKINYLNNKDMLKEIHLSKSSFSEYTDIKYRDYDVIVESIEEIFLPEVQESGRISRAARMGAIAFANAIANTSARSEKPRLIDHKVKPETISTDILVYRVLTFDHIPLAPGRKKNPKNQADNHVKLNFFPFKHFIIEGGKAVEVGRSHSKNGKFNLEKGCITNKLANMYILLVNRYAQRSNWRSYTYIDEMKGQALLQLAQMGLQFDEAKSDNPFSYYTQSMQNSFTRVLNLEKRNQELRDDLLIDSGASPSFSRQLALEADIRYLREEAQEAARGDND